MKFKYFMILICILAMSVSGCAISRGCRDDTDLRSSVSSIEARISQLEACQDTLGTGHLIELEGLRAELESLKKGSQAESTTAAAPLGERFAYSIDNGKAIIGGYGGKDTYLAIPTHIDGYEVTGIGKNAFASSSLKCVIIGEGVQSIDWFAFRNSAFLSEITIPSSVTEIGYSAFEGCSSGLTIYCARDSYAYSYAKSYGISYVIV